MKHGSVVGNKLLYAQLLSVKDCCGLKSLSVEPIVRVIAESRDRQTAKGTEIINRRGVEHCRLLVHANEAPAIC